MLTHDDGEVHPVEISASINLSRHASPVPFHPHHDLGSPAHFYTPERSTLLPPLLPRQNPSHVVDHPDDDNDDDDGPHTPRNSPTPPLTFFTPALPGAHGDGGDTYDDTYFATSPALTHTRPTSDPSSPSPSVPVSPPQLAYYTPPPPPTVTFRTPTRTPVDLYFTAQMQHGISPHAPRTPLGASDARTAIRRIQYDDEEQSHHTLRGTSSSGGGSGSASLDLDPASAYHQRTRTTGGVNTSTGTSTSASASASASTPYRTSSTTKRTPVVVTPVPHGSVRGPSSPMPVPTLHPLLSAHPLEFETADRDLSPSAVVAMRRALTAATAAYHEMGIHGSKADPKALLLLAWTVILVPLLLGCQLVLHGDLRDLLEPVLRRGHAGMVGYLQRLGVVAPTPSTALVWLGPSWGDRLRATWDDVLTRIHLPVTWPAVVLYRNTTSRSRSGVLHSLLGKAPPTTTTMTMMMMTGIAVVGVIMMIMIAVAPSGVLGEHVRDLGVCCHVVVGEWADVVRDGVRRGMASIRGSEETTTRRSTGKTPAKKSQRKRR